MKISPIDIRQHTFEKGFRGYDVDEVGAFLNSLSQEWERVTNESKMLKMQLEIAEKELNKLRDVELTLFRTLKTAEDTSAQITEQANKAAEKYLQESKLKSDETVNEAKRKASMLIQDAENQARYVKEELINELKNQERDFKAIEKYRDNLIVQLKTLVSNTNDTVDRFEKKFTKDSFQNRMEEIKQQIAEVGADKLAQAPEDTTEAADASSSDATASDAPASDAPVISEVVATSQTVDTNSEVVESTEEVPAYTREPQAEAAEPEEAEVSGELEAAVAMAEAEQVKETSRQATGTLTKNRSEEAEPVEKKAGGSFFDQFN